MRLRRGIIKRLHVDQHVLRRNRKTGESRGPITVQTSGGSHKASRVSILDSNGTPVATFIYRPAKPLSCGASLWIETTAELEMT